MSEVHFWTPGRIPIEAFTIMGANVKLGENPIGRFGTGLKYAVAVILRHGGEIKVNIGSTEYLFYACMRNFRGQKIEQVRMRKRKALSVLWSRSMQLPFTTQLGRDWKLWQAYRELESNTRDEGGQTMVGTASQCHAAHEGGTMISVSCPGFAKEVEEAKVFLDPTKLTLKAKDHSLEVFDDPSPYLYYRGIRVYTLRFPARMTYNFTGSITLTEDRTCAYPYYLYSLISSLYQSCGDGDLLRKVMQKPGKDEPPCFETNDLTLDADVESHEVFRSVAASLVASGTGGRSILTYHTMLPRMDGTDKKSIELTESQWGFINDVLAQARDNLALLVQDEYDAIEALIKAIEETKE